MNERKKSISPPLAGGDEGEGEGIQDFYESVILGEMRILIKTQVWI
jgi:hypothetical protein